MKKLFLLLALVFPFALQAQVTMMPAASSGDTYNITNSADEWTLEMSGVNLKLSDTLLYVIPEGGTLESAVADIGGTYRTIMINQSVSAAASAKLTVPSNITIIMLANGRLNSTDSLLIYGAFYADRRSVFSGLTGRPKVKLYGNKVVCPEWWGADPTDTAADQNSITYAMNSINDYGGTVYFADGDYYLYSTITIPELVNWQGTFALTSDTTKYDNGTTIVKQNTLSGFNITGSTSDHSGRNEISHIRFLDSSTGSPQGDYIAATYADDVYIHDVLFQGHHGSAYNSRVLYAYDCDYWQIERVNFVDCGYGSESVIELVDGTTSGKTTEHWKFIDVIFENPNYRSVYLRNIGSGDTIEDIIFERCAFKSRNATVTNEYVVGYGNNISFNNCYFDDNSSSAISATSGYYWFVNNCYFYNVSVSLNLNTAGSRILNNTFVSCGDPTVHLNASSTTIMTGNTTTTSELYSDAPVVYNSWIYGNNLGSNHTDYEFRQNAAVTKDDTSFIHLADENNAYHFSIGYDIEQDSLIVTSGTTHNNHTLNLAIDRATSKAYYKGEWNADSLTTQKVVLLDSTFGVAPWRVTLATDAGSPEGAKAYAQGSLYLDWNAGRLEDGIWFKESGLGNTGWASLEDGIDIESVRADTSLPRQLRVGSAFTPYSAATAVAHINGNISTENGAYLLMDTDPTINWYVGVYTGENSPETNQVANKGAAYLRHGGSSLDELLYLKASGIGNTGWEAVPLLEAYGGLYCDGASELIDLTMDVWAAVSDGSGTLLDIFSPAKNVTESGDVLVLTKAGDYRWDLSISFQGAAATTYEITIDHEGVRKNVMSYYTSATTTVTLSTGGFITATANDEIFPTLRNITDNDDITIIDVSLRVEKL